METVLLGFCLISLTLSSVIVAVELARDGRKQRQIKRPLNLKASVAKTQTSNYVLVEEDPLMPVHPVATQSNRVLDSLVRQLSSLGYTSNEQQLGFVNWALNTERNSLHEIDHQEMQHLFKIIRRYTPTETAIPTPTMA